MGRGRLEWSGQQFFLGIFNQVFNYVLMNQLVSSETTSLTD